MDARIEGKESPAHRSEAVCHRPGAFRPADPVDSRESADGRVGAVGPARHASGAPVVGGPVHEGLRPGGRRPSPLASGAAGIPLAEALRAPLDELRAGDRAVVPGGAGGVRRPLPGTRAADARPAPGGVGLLQEPAGGGRGRLSQGDVRQPRAGAGAPAALVEHAPHLGLQAGQAVRDVRPDQLRGARGRVAPPDLPADDDHDLRPDLAGGRGHRQADLRPPRARRRLHRPTAPRHRGHAARSHPRRAPARSVGRPGGPQDRFRPRPAPSANPTS